MKVARVELEVSAAHRLVDIAVLGVAAVVVARVSHRGTEHRASLESRFQRQALSIANGATFWIRWNDLNPAGSDDGLAVDEVIGRLAAARARTAKEQADPVDLLRERAAALSAAVGVDALGPERVLGVR